MLWQYVMVDDKRARELCVLYVCDCVCHSLSLIVINRLGVYWRFPWTLYVIVDYMCVSVCHGCLSVCMFMSAYLLCCCSMSLSVCISVYTWSTCWTFVHCLVLHVCVIMCVSVCVWACVWSLFVLVYIQIVNSLVML